MLSPLLQKNNSVSNTGTLFQLSSNARINVLKHNFSDEEKINCLDIMFLSNQSLRGKLYEKGWLILQNLN